MATSSVILILIVAGSILAAVTLWNAANGRAYRDRAQRDNLLRPAANKRSNDARPLTPQEQRMLKRAKTMAAQGNHRTAASLLEQIGLHREAITVLEEANLIDDAAAILIKMNRPNRAGVVYARHGKWLQAAEWFRHSGMTLEAAKCLREGESYEEAAALFVEGGRLEDAANCLALGKKWQAAGRLQLKLSQTDKAFKSYERLFSERDQWSDLSLEQTELNFIQAEVIRGKSVPGFVDVLVRNGRVLDIVRALVVQGKITEAASLFSQSPSDLGPLLMSEVNMQSQEGRNLGDMFLTAKQPRYAGMVFEQMGDFHAAAQAFEEGEEFERSAYCWERTGDRARSKANKERKAAVDSALPPVTPSSGFNSLSEGKTEIVDTADRMPKSAKKAPSVSVAVPQQDHKSTRVGVFSLEGGNTNIKEEPNNSEDRRVFDGCPLFAGLDQEQKTNLWKSGSVQAFDAGVSIVDVGAQPGCLYVVLEGELECVRINEAGHPVVAEAVTVGHCFGEKWLLADQEYIVHLLAKATSRLLVIEQAKFIDLLDKDGALTRKVYKNFTATVLTPKNNVLKFKENRLAS